jgi:hypothetical protein
MSAPPFYHEYIYIPIYLGILLKKGIESAYLLIQGCNITHS